MNRNEVNNRVQHLVEFSLIEDKFAKARQKGSKRWISAHIFSGKNKILVYIVLFTTLLSATMSSAQMVVIGIAVNEFINGNAGLLKY